MAQYEFQHPDGRVIAIHQPMESEHKYVDAEGVEWSRLFSNPSAIIDSVFSIDPNNSQEFVRKTGQRSGKLNDIMQLSAELSEKRKQKDGIDVFKERSMDRYEQSRVKGTQHPDRKKQKLQEIFGKNKHFDVDVD